MWSYVKINKDFLHKIKIVSNRSFRNVLHIFVSVAIVRKEGGVIWSQRVSHMESSDYKLFLSCGENPYRINFVKV